MDTLKGNMAKLMMTMSEIPERENFQSMKNKNLSSRNVSLWHHCRNTCTVRGYRQHRQQYNVVQSVANLLGIGDAKVNVPKA